MTALADTFLVRRGHRLPAADRPGAAASPPARVDESMLPAPSVVSVEQVAEEARRHFAPGLSCSLPVVDHAGRAVGVLHAHDVAALPPLDRASRLVAGLVDRDPALLAPAATDAAEVLGREAVVRTGFAMVTDGRGRLVGVTSPPEHEQEQEQEQPCNSPAFASTSPPTPT